MVGTRWRKRLRTAVHPLYARLPSSVRSGLRGVLKPLETQLLSKRDRWIRGTYTSFNRDQRRQIFMHIAQFAHVNRPIDGYYLEFGCHGANTIRLAFDCFRHLFDWNYVAFDSFEGLPEITSLDAQVIWEKGKLATSEDRLIEICMRHGIPRDRLTTVKGFYDASLTNELKRRLLPLKAAVIYVDCDLYLSTASVLRFIKDFLQPGTVIVFDDWNCFLADPDRGERRAWREFLRVITGAPFRAVRIERHAGVLYLHGPCRGEELMPVWCRRLRNFAGLPPFGRDRADAR